LFNILCETIIDLRILSQRENCHRQHIHVVILSALSIIIENSEVCCGATPWYEMCITTRETLHYAFFENTRDKILFLVAVVQCTSSSCQDLEVTESCQALDGRCGAISPNKVDERGTEREREKGERKREREWRRWRKGRKEGEREREGVNDGEGRES